MRDEECVRRFSDSCWSSVDHGYRRRSSTMDLITGKAAAHTMAGTHLTSRGNKTKRFSTSWIWRLQFNEVKDRPHHGKRRPKLYNALAANSSYD